MKGRVAHSWAEPCVHCPTVGSFSCARSLYHLAERGGVPVHLPGPSLGHTNHDKPYEGIGKPSQLLPFSNMSHANVATEKQCTSLYIIAIALLAALVIVSVKMACTAGTVTVTVTVTVTATVTVTVTTNAGGA